MFDKGQKQSSMLSCDSSYFHASPDELEADVVLFSCYIFLYSCYYTNLFIIFCFSLLVSVM